MNTFTESQRFRQGWVWLFVAFSALITLGALLSDPVTWHVVIPFVFIVVLLYVWRLDTRLDAEGIHYRVFPILPWRTIPWSAIQLASVRVYGFVGYGIRWGLEGWVYNVAGRKGLHINYLNGHHITIGTQRPEEIQHFLEQLHVP
ncbi:hypothetical protein [Spirosoma sp. KNUC1025]|uniref:hypothetical protein n=1 Tax=Spirosoma sp. KNUC1025 TaxID=2894082 RepID=UPI00386443FC|nr:hypothetical protein LN737_22410 [Spirosoma sp. KNUC1025]